MFNIGFSEMILIAVIALIALGPEQLPGVAKMFGKLLGEVRKVKEEFTRQIHESTSETVVTFRNASKIISDPVNQAKQSIENDLKSCLTPEPITEAKTEIDSEEPAKLDSSEGKPT